MSEEVLLRGFISGIIALAFSWVVFSRYDDEIGSEVTDAEHQKYLPYIPGNLLPLFLLTILILGTWEYGFGGAARMTLSMCFSIFLHISLYYLILILVLPFLRRHFSARACAMLWLVPNYLYLIQQSYMELPSPLLVITTSGNLVWVLLCAWFMGFAGVLIWKIIEHLVFRHRVLDGAYAVTDPDALAVWNKVIEEAHFKKPKFKLLISPNVSTPLTIGLLRRATRVILPEKKYSLDDLELILRHEIVHIGREDAWSKFFMVFCTAMCWFNPLMWMAMRKSADDLELSCDETVLLNTDETTRKQYALLLLDTAGDERGFTTCLSASANAMRYRLKNITKPAKKRSGALLVGAVFFALCMTSGYVALAYDGNTGAQMLYQCDEFTDYTIRDISMHDDDFNTQFEIRDEAAFHDYLAGLTVYELTGNYSFSDSERYYFIIMDTPTGTQVFTLFDDVIKLVWLHQGDRPAEYYYVPGGLDWEYIDSIIVPHPALNVHLVEDGDAYGKDLTTVVNYLWKTENGKKELIFETDYPDVNTPVFSVMNHMKRLSSSLKSWLRLFPFS